MTEKFIGIVLRTLKYNDNLMIADILTETHGRASFLVPISRGRSKKTRNTLFQPLSILSFNASHKKRGLGHLSEAHPYILYNSIPYNPYKSAIALYLSEFLTRALHEENDSSELFAFIEFSLRQFDETSEGYANFHLIFLMRLTRFLGISPNLEEMKHGKYFDLAAGCFVNTQPAHPHFLTSEKAIKFFSALSNEYNKETYLIPNRNTRNEYLGIIQQYYQLHIPDFPILKSTEVLKELFD